MINALKNTLRSLLLNVEKEHNKWYKVIKDLAEEVFIEETTPRICGRQKHRANTVANPPSDYYRRTITQPFQMSERFSEESMIPYYGLFLVTSNSSNIRYFQTDKIGKKAFLSLQIFIDTIFEIFLVCLVNVIYGLIIGNFKILYQIILLILLNVYPQDLKVLK